MIMEHSTLIKYHEVLLNSIQGKYSKALEMREDFVLAMSRSNTSASINKRKVQKVNQRPSKNQHPRGQQKIVKKKKEKKGTAETILIILFLALAYVLYIYGQLI